MTAQETGKPAHLLKVGPEGLDVDGLDLVVARPDDLAAGVHGGHGLLAPDLDQHRPLIVAQAHTAASQTLPRKLAFTDILGTGWRCLTQVGSL